MYAFRVMRIHHRNTQRYRIIYIARAGSNKCSVWSIGQVLMHDDITSILLYILLMHDMIRQATHGMMPTPGDAWYDIYVRQCVVRCLC